MGIIATAAIATGPIARAASTRGVTPTTLKIGNTMPYSGSGSAYSNVGKAESAFFKWVNDRGGVGGRNRVPVLRRHLQPAQDGRASAPPGRAGRGRLPERALHLGRNQRKKRMGRAFPGDVPCVLRQQRWSFSWGYHTHWEGAMAGAAQADCGPDACSFNLG